MKWFIILSWIFTLVLCNVRMELMSKTRTTFLEKYEGYVDTVMVHLIVPQDSSFASFKFVADETKMSIFSCTPRKVSLYMKHNSPPVINPDGSKFPSTFKNITRSELYNIEFLTDKKVQYMNITSPEPGSYYVATFLSYTDPREQSIQPPGLGAQCFANVEATLLTTKPSNYEQIVDENRYSVTAVRNSSVYYKFYVPTSIDHAIVIIDEISFSKVASFLVIRIQVNTIPSEKSSLKTIRVDLESDEQSVYIPFNTEEDKWHFLEFLFGGTSDTLPGIDNNSTLKFTLRYFSKITDDKEDDDTYNTAIQKIYRSDNISDIVPYKQYNLVRESTTDSFLFSYDLKKKITSSTAVAVNMTSTEFSALKFSLRENTDVGGSLQFILAYKPRIKKTDQGKILEKEPESYSVVGCIRSDVPEIPTWPNLCSYKGTQIVAPIVLNKSIDNSTVQIPFPESGDWFATFKLFCGECETCSCPDKCQQEYRMCRSSCEATCTDSSACDNCTIDCKDGVIAKEGCAKCDCDGPCIRSKTVCNSSVMFDISSYACIAGGCGKNGRCTFMVSDGIVYSTCVCTNNYRGWDCSDDTLANPYWMIVLELLLLVLSNLMFLPTVFFAYRRKYYVEATVYFSICFSSTFYHACDAGENVISYCMLRLGALQFADFFCAVLAIWVTLIAIANLPSFWPNLCQILGAIVLAVATTVNKTSVWIFALPVITSVIIIGISWYFKYRKIRQRFLDKRYVYIYLPLGVLVGGLGVLIFSLLQTTRNYKYLHSLWHILMATAVILVLPRRDTFQLETML